ncbi:MAG TPA: HAD-IIIC family phosphatase [Acidobacteriaceae bacterium]|jgi:FkbH-like protein|nr:HAD-IIIC family phosphatase [Acidobacteriaceae bacterium]
MNLDQYTVDELFRKRLGLRRQLSAVEGLQPLRIAVLGGTTTHEVVDLLELFLLESGFKPVFHQSEYGRFYEDAVQDPADLIAFEPDIVYLHTSCLNVQSVPPVHCSEDEFQGYVDAEARRYRQIWQSIEQNVSAQIIQNNFETPPYAILGNFDAVWSGGAVRYFMALNMEFARSAATDPRLLLQDIHSLSARMGTAQWFDWDRYFSYKILTTTEANVAIARSLTSLVRAMYGKSRKVLVLDLDNTLWGGVIGDDGVDKIQIGRETPVAEAYTAFQEYCLSLQRRGVLLAVCSKNNEDVAKSGFEHPSSVLKLEHISCFKANWEPKHENILAIAKELNLGTDSFVFVDDNPAERALVAAQIAGIAVPEVGAEVSRYAAILEAGRYFEPVSMSKEDLSRTALYEANAARASSEAQFANYGEYLDSLEMQAEIAEFKPVYLERITQLTNKTNQFNLTTRRYTQADIEAIAADPNYIGIYGRLLDRFGDNGLVSIVLGRREGDELELDLWLMSCRVLKRDMEQAMLDVLVERARAANIRTLKGFYLPTKKNGMVANHYEKLGFAPVSLDSETNASAWSLDVPSYAARNRHIRILELVHG